MTGRRHLSAQCRRAVLIEHAADATHRVRAASLERRRSEVMRAARPEEAVQRTTKTPLAERHLPNADGQNTTSQM